MYVCICLNVTDTAIRREAAAGHAVCAICATASVCPLNAENAHPALKKFYKTPWLKTAWNPPSPQRD